MPASPFSVARTVRDHHEAIVFAVVSFRALSRYAVTGTAGLMF